MALTKSKILGEEDYFTDIGVPMPLSGWFRIRGENITGIPYPKYSGKSFHWLSNNLCFIPFCKDVDDMNRNSASPVDRNQMDAIWLQILLLAYVLWDPRELTKCEGAGNELAKKKAMLRQALDQVYDCVISILANECLTYFQRKGKDVETYWKEKAMHFPGLFIKANKSCILGYI
jgi:hypothetical protein